jgi:D-alanyl-D-alanine carboxypeptidase
VSAATSTTEVKVVPQTSTTTDATSTTLPATTVVSPSTTSPVATPFVLPGIDPSTSQFPALATAYNQLLRNNLAVSVSVRRDNQPTFAAANGLTNSWQLVSPQTPMVIASVSKLITAVTIARLAQLGSVDVSAPMPWDALGVVHDPAWNDVTIRELLSHTGGMPIARSSWFNKAGACTVPLAEAMSTPPRASRGRWTYSNGNYCALGLLVENITGMPFEVAAQQLIFDPLAIRGPHLTTDPHPSTDAPYLLGLDRLQRLGAAGTWMVSTNDIAAMLAALTPIDMETLQWPGIVVDQYGWGHTGTVDGAKSCAWVMEGGRTVVSATIAGNSPQSGGGICDIIVPALASDLGIWADRPIRIP